MGKNRRLIALLVGALVIAVAAWVAYGVFKDDPKAATWRVDPAATMSPESEEVPILVMEADCTSGRLATGRIVAKVTYTTESIIIDIKVNPLGAGDYECQGVETPYLVVLNEPVGERELIDPHAATP